MRIIQRAVVMAVLAICLPCSAGVLPMADAAPIHRAETGRAAATNASPGVAHASLTYEVAQTDTTTVTEPGSLALMGFAILGVAAALRYRRKTKTTSQRQSP